MLDQVVPKLLEGEFICEATSPSLFRALADADKGHDLLCCGRARSGWRGPIGNAELDDMPPAPRSRGMEG